MYQPPALRTRGTPLAANGRSHRRSRYTPRTVSNDITPAPLDARPLEEPGGGAALAVGSAAPERGLRAGLRALGREDAAVEEAAEDPYYAPRPYDGPPRTSPFAIAALLSAVTLGPLGGALTWLLGQDEKVIVIATGIVSVAGGLAAVGLGWLGRREVEEDSKRRRGHLLATVSMATGLVLSVGACTVMALYGYVDARREARKKQRESLVEVEMPREREREPPHRQPPIFKAPPPPPPQGSVPKQTVVKREGSITVVDVGTGAVSLVAELEAQRAAAEKEGQTLVLMVTADPCGPCRGVDVALKDPKMQKALDKVRLVRADTHVFDKDLTALRVPHDHFPGFFLLGKDLVPRDGVDGGEWDDDIPDNIAPVLGPFVKGAYTKRRKEFKLAPPKNGGGIRL